MTQRYLEYMIVDPPKAVQQARLDNVALVPASLLTQKNKYQTITQNLPRGGVLLGETPQKPQITRILARVATFLREKGHVVRIVPYSGLV